jgi:hypothetical protein
MLGTIENLFVVVLREVRGELMNPTEVELPTRDHVKNAGKSVGRAAGSDTLRGDCLRHVKASRAESEHRGARVLEVQLSAIDLRDVGEQRGGVAAVSVHQGREVPEEVLFVEVPKR